MEPVKRRVAVAASAWAGLAFVCTVAAAQVAPPSEYDVKAAYLVKFPSYVEWPSSAFAASNSPLVLCIVGADPFGPPLDEAAAGQQVQGHPLLVRRLKTIGRDSGCHIAFVGIEPRSEALAGSGVLVVSDTPAGGGIISFVVQGNRVRFHVDDQAAALNNLVISSKLLSVALSVKPRSKG